MAEVIKDTLTESCSAVRVIVDQGPSTPLLVKYDKADYSAMVQARVTTEGLPPGTPVRFFVQFDYASPDVMGGTRTGDAPGTFCPGLNVLPLYLVDRQLDHKLRAWDGYAEYSWPATAEVDQAAYRATISFSNPSYNPQFNPQSVPEYQQFLDWGYSPEEAAEAVRRNYGSPDIATFQDVWHFPEPFEGSVWNAVGCDGSDMIAEEWPFTARHYQRHGFETLDGVEVSGDGGKAELKLYEQPPGGAWVLRRTYEFARAPAVVTLLNWDDCDDACVPIFRGAKQDFICICKGVPMQGPQTKRNDAAVKDLDYFV